jgi:hypothetical protein
MNFDAVISRTVYEYFLERKQELRRISNVYKTCVHMPTRRELRSKKEELVTILDRADNYLKQNLAFKVGLSFAELKNYPELLEVERKRTHLVNSTL